MDSRERVEATLRHSDVDRVPVDFWASREVKARLLTHYAVNSFTEVLDRFNVDFRYIEGPVYVGPELKRRADGSVEDHFGVPRVQVPYGSGVASGYYSEVVEFPLAHVRSVDEVEDYGGWPDPNWFDYECVREQARRARESGRAVVFMGDRLNRCAQLKPAMYMRGVDQILVDTVLDPEIAHAILGRCRDFYLEYARRALEAAEGNLDIFFTGDDYGMQTNTFMSVACWQEFLSTGFRRFIELGHEFGCRVAHHTCGSVASLIPELIECGLDILNPLQPEAAHMDHERIKTDFGSRLSFHGGISIQTTMPHGTPEEVRRDVCALRRRLGTGGGLIFCTAHNLQVDVPLENIEALIGAYREYGGY